LLFKAYKALSEHVAYIWHIF